MNFLGMFVQRTAAGTTITLQERKNKSSNMELRVEGSEQAMATSVAQFTDSTLNRDAAVGIPDAVPANRLQTQSAKTPQNSEDFPRSYSSTTNNTGGNLHRGLTGYGVTPPRADVAHLRSSVGDQVYYGSEILCPHDKLGPSKIGAVSDADLGVLRHRFSEARGVWGEALDVAQQDVRAARVQREKMKQERAHLSSAAADRALAKLPAHRMALRAQLAASATARVANQEIAIFLALIRAIDAEMIRRCRALGLIAVPGRVHQTLVRSAQRFRRLSMNLKRPSLRIAPGRSGARTKASA